MGEIIKIIEGLPKMLHLTPANEASVCAAEAELGLKFAEDYRAYTMGFGAISASGIELTGVVDAKRLDVVNVTKQERELNELLPENMYVIENIAIDGIVILQNPEGEVFSISPFNAPEKIADSLADYIASTQDVIL